MYYDMNYQEPDTQFHIVQELGNCHASVGNDHEAKQHFDQAASMEPDSPDPYIGLGVIALGNDELDDAEIAFRVACRLDAKCSKAYSGLAMIAQRREDYKTAFDFYLKSLELDTDNLTALLGLFQASCQMGSFAKVIHYLQVYLTMHPADTSVMFSLAALHIKDSNLNKAQQMLQKILEIDIDNTDAQNLLEEVEHNLAQKAPSPLFFGSHYAARAFV